jgi:hypothetical protein
MTSRVPPIEDKVMPDGDNAAAHMPAQSARSAGIMTPATMQPTPPGEPLKSKT